MSLLSFFLSPALQYPFPLLLLIFKGQHSNTNEALIIGFEEEIPEWIFDKYEVLDKNEELNCVLVKVREKVSIRDLTGVKYVERNKLVHALYLPNDSRFDEQWGLKSINVDKAWDLERGSKEITLAGIRELIMSMKI